MTQIEIWETLLGSAVGMYITKEVVAFIKDRRKANRESKQTFDEVLPKVNAIYEAMQEIQYKTGACRVLLLTAHNGGGRPAIGSLMRSSVVYEVANGKAPMRESWQGQLLDYEYMKVLVGLDAGGTYSALVSELKEGLQKQMLVSHGIVGTVLTKITTDEKNFYYLAVNFDKKAEFNTPPISEHIRGGANKILNLWE
jgi:hypothetical protein